MAFQGVQGFERWERRWSRYFPYFLISLAVFGVGLLFGSLATEVLTVGERSQLHTVLESLVRWESAHLILPSLYRAALISNLKILGLLYVLGISVAGIPLVLAVLFFRGFVVGFALAFLAQNLRGQGLGVTIATVVAQNLFMVPVFVVSGTLALWFSWSLLSSRARAERVSLWPALASYTGISAVLALALAWASLVEVIASPLLLHAGGLIH